MANTFYKKQSKTVQAFVYELVRFLMDDLAGQTGPGGWTLIHVYDPNAAITHDQPSGDGTDMTQLPADNAWRDGSGLAVASYAILENDAGTQIGIEYQANDEIHIVTAPKGGYDTGSANNDLTNAAHWSETVFTFVDADTANAGGSGNWSIVAIDQSTAYVVYEDGVDARMQIIVLGDAEIDDPDITYKAIQYNTPENAGLIPGAAMGDSTSFDMISPVDDSTLVDVAGGILEFDSADILTSADYGNNAHNSKRWFFDIPLAIVTPGHYAVVGKLKQMYATNENIIGTGVQSYDSDNYLILSDTANYGKLVLPWDGTAY